MTHRFSRLLSVSLLIVFCGSVFNMTVFAHEENKCFTDEWRKVFELLSGDSVIQGKTQYDINHYKPKHISNYLKWKNDCLNTGSLPEEESHCVYRIAMSLPMDPPSNDSGCSYRWDSGYSYASDLIGKARSLIYCANTSENQEDCNSEFEDVASAHSSYEDIISDIESVCGL